MPGCATETSVKDGSDALKVLLAGIETRFREEHTALVCSINEQKAITKVQTALLSVLCGEVKTIHEKIDVLCSFTDRLGHIEGDVAAIAGTVQAVGKKADTVSSFVTRQNEHLDDDRLVFHDRFNEVKKVEETMQPSSLEGT